MADLAGVNGQRKDFRVVGKPNLPGRPPYSIATGVAKYRADYAAPYMLHTNFLRSPYANAIIKNGYRLLSRGQTPLLWLAL